MTALGLCLAFLGLSISPSKEFQRLARCVEQKDAACVSACLKDGSSDHSPEYFELAARAYMLLKQNQEALKSIAQAIQLKPGNYDYLMEQGWMYQRSGDQVSAIESFLLASHINPQSATVFYELGMSFFLAKEYDRAIRHFNHALQLDPKNDKAEFMIGVVQIWQGHLEEAKLHFAAALKLQPRNPHYLLHYGVLLTMLNEDDLALANMREAEKLDPSNPLTHFQLGKRYRLMGKLATPARNWQRLFVSGRTFLPPFINWGRFTTSWGGAKARDDTAESSRSCRTRKNGRHRPNRRQLGKLSLFAASGARSSIATTNAL